MARLSISRAAAPDPTAINLTRLIARLQNTLLKPVSETEQRLLSSPYERSKVSANLDHARRLLLRLEQESANIKIQSRKTEAQTELLVRRDQIQILSERLEELETYEHGTDPESSEGEDLLGEDTPSEDYNDHTPSEHLTEDAGLSTSISALDQYQPPSPSQPQPPLSAREQRNELFPSSLRARHAASSTADTGVTTSSDAVTSTTEKLLTHHRTEQESLTADLLGMAQALKKSSTSFSRTLEDEDDVLKRATAGLDRNVGGLEVASRKMGVLKRMSEGRGWFGRMGLYAGIFGLWVLAILVVGVLPKLRF